MNEVRDHGPGVVLPSISCKFGLLEQYGPSAAGNLGISTFSEVDLNSSVDMVPSSSASQSPTDEHGELTECTESMEMDDVFRAIITCSQKVALRFPSTLGLRTSNAAGTLSCCRR